MKKICTNTRRSGLLFPLLCFLSGLLLTGCAFTDYGNRINREQLDIARLEDKRHNLETQFIIVLNNLAQTLSDLGRHDEALSFAERALAAGGPFSGAVQKTRDAILERLRKPSVQ